MKMVDTQSKKELGSSTHGIDLVTFAMLDRQTGNVLTGTDQGLSDNGIKPIYQDIQGASQVEYQNLEREGTMQYANDDPKRMTHPTQAPTANLTFLDIAWMTLNKLLGYEQGEDGGYSLNGTEKPYFAMLTRSTFLDGSALYEALACATAILPTNQHQTDNDSEQDANISLTAHAFKPINPDVFKVKSGKQMPYRRWNSMDPKFSPEKMMAQVFPGYKLDDTMKIVVPTWSGSTTSSSNPSDSSSTGQPTQPKKEN